MAAAIDSASNEWRTREVIKGKSLPKQEKQFQQGSHIHSGIPTGPPDGLVRAREIYRSHHFDTTKKSKRWRQILKNPTSNRIVIAGRPAPTGSEYIRQKMVDSQVAIASRLTPTEEQEQ
jgi:hypothetical protein